MSWTPHYTDPPWHRDGREIRAERGMVICTLGTPGEDLSPGDIKNGQLIEQAPVLLAALQRLVDAVERGQGDHAYALEGAKAAIREALEREAEGGA